MSSNHGSGYAVFPMLYYSLSLSHPCFQLLSMTPCPPVFFLQSSFPTKNSDYFPAQCQPVFVCLLWDADWIFKCCSGEPHLWNVTLTFTALIAFTAHCLVMTISATWRQHQNVCVMRTVFFISQSMYSSRVTRTALTLTDREQQRLRKWDVCDQYLIYSSQKYNRLKWSWVLCVWVNIAIFCCFLSCRKCI